MIVLSYNTTVSEVFKAKIDNLISYIKEEECIYSTFDLNYLRNEMFSLKRVNSASYDTAVKKFSIFLNFIEAHKDVAHIQNLFERSFNENYRGFILAVCEILLRYKYFYYRYKYPELRKSHIKLNYNSNDAEIFKRLENSTIKISDALCLSYTDIDKLQYIWQKFLEKSPVAPFNNPFLNDIDPSGALLSSVSQITVFDVKRNLIDVLIDLKNSLPDCGINFFKINGNMIEGLIATENYLPRPKVGTEDFDFGQKCLALRRERSREFQQIYYSGEIDRFWGDVNAEFDVAEKEMINTLSETGMLFTSDTINEFNEFFSFPQKWFSSLSLVHLKLSKNLYKTLFEEVVEHNDASSSGNRVRMR